jgi:cholesterol transport system auxiliary component
MKRWLAVLVCLLAAGCTGSLLDSKEAPSDVFRITPVTVNSGGPVLSAALGVLRPRAPASLDTNRVAVEQTGGVFDYYAGVRWAESAPQMLQSVLVATLAGDGGFAATLAAPSRVPTEFLLDVELRRYTAVYGGAAAPRVYVQWQATLLDGRRGTRIASFVAKGEAAAAENRREAMVAAFQSATTAATAETVRQVRLATAAVRP